MLCKDISVITGAFWLDSFFQVHNIYILYADSNTHTVDWTADCVRRVFLSENGRERGKDSECVC